MDMSEVYSYVYSLEGVSLSLVRLYVQSVLAHKQQDVWCRVCSG